MQNRLYIGRLSDRVRERDVQDFFRGYGKVKDIIMKNGYGFVDLDDDRDADAAVEDLHGRELCGERVILERARGPGNGRGGARSDFGGGRGYDRGYDRGDRGYDRGYGGSRGGRDTERPAWVDKYGPVIRTKHRLIVENLSSRVSWQDLKDFMRQAGEVTFAEAHKNVKNEGVVEFVSRGDMKNAMTKLDGTEMNGRKIKLVIEESKHSASRTRSRSRRRSDSRDKGSRRRRNDSDDRGRSPPERSRSGSREPSRDSRNDRRSRSRS